MNLFILLLFLSSSFFLIQSQSSQKVKWVTLWVDQYNDTFQDPFCPFSTPTSQPLPFDAYNQSSDPLPLFRCTLREALSSQHRNFSYMIYITQNYDVQNTPLVASPSIYAVVNGTRPDGSLVTISPHELHSTRQTIGVVFSSNITFSRICFSSFSIALTDTSIGRPGILSVKEERDQEVRQLIDLRRSLLFLEECEVRENVIGIELLTPKSKVRVVGCKFFANSIGISGYNIETFGSIFLSHSQVSVICGNFYQSSLFLSSVNDSFSPPTNMSTPDPFSSRQSDETGYSVSDISAMVSIFGVHCPVAGTIFNTTVYSMYFVVPPQMNLSYTFTKSVFLNSPFGVFYESQVSVQKNSSRPVPVPETLAPSPDLRARLLEILSSVKAQIPMNQSQPFPITNTTMFSSLEQQRTADAQSESLDEREEMETDLELEFNWQVDELISLEPRSRARLELELESSSSEETFPRQAPETSISQLVATNVILDCHFANTALSLPPLVTSINSTSFKFVVVSIIPPPALEITIERDIQNTFAKETRNENKKRASDLPEFQVVIYNSTFTGCSFNQSIFSTFHTLVFLNSSISQSVPLFFPALSPSLIYSPSYLQRNYSTEYYYELFMNSSFAQTFLSNFSRPFGNNSRPDWDPSWLSSELFQLYPNIGLGTYLPAFTVHSLLTVSHSNFSENSNFNSLFLVVGLDANVFLLDSEFHQNLFLEVSNPSPTRSTSTRQQNQILQGGGVARVTGDCKNFRSTKSTFTQNFAPFGGVLYTLQDSFAPFFKNCTFNFNQAIGSGSDIFAPNVSVIFLINNNFDSYDLSKSVVGFVANCSQQYICDLTSKCSQLNWGISCVATETNNTMEIIFYTVIPFLIMGAMIAYLLYYRHRLDPAIKYRSLVTIKGKVNVDDNLDATPSQNAENDPNANAGHNHL